MKGEKREGRNGFRVQSSKLILLLLLFVGLSTAYNVATPLFESPDEISHFRYAAWFADGKGLPNMLADASTIGHEVWQPPLYYALVGWVIAGIPRFNEAQLTQLNPYWWQGGGKNVFYHLPAEQFPYHQTSLAVHLARFVSTVLGCLTLVATYGLGRLVVPRYALFATALVMFNPQFLFISASVNNDNLVTTLCALLLWLSSAWLLQPKPPLGSYFLLGGLWGAAILAKVNAASFLLLFLLIAGYTAGSHRTWRPVGVGLPSLGVAGIAVAGWWFIQNWATYGDPLAWSVLRAITSDMFRPAWLSWGETIPYAGGLLRSYWAMFGHGISLPNGFYWVINGLLLLILLGSFRWLRQAALKERFMAILCLLWNLILFASLLRWMRQMAFTDQGRLLFAAVTALAVLGATGLAGWRLAMSDWQRATGDWLGRGLLTILGVVAIASPWAVIASTYAYPPALEVNSSIPNEATVLFGDQLALRGYELSSSTISGSNSLTVDLYWQAVAPMTENYLVAVHLLDAAGELVSALDTIPYNGRYQTGMWQMGYLFRDSYRMPALSPHALPGKATLLIKVYAWGKPDAPLFVKIADQNAGNSLYLTSLKIAPSEVAHFAPSQTADAQFGQLGRLIGFDAPPQAQPDSTLSLTLYWEAWQPDQKEYVVFVHLRDEQNQLVAQADGPPQGNRYPTSIWAAGEQIEDQREINVPTSLPPASYRLVIGWYDPLTGQRLSATHADGSSWQNNEVELGKLQIENQNR